MKKIYGVDIGIGMCIDEVLAKKPDQNRIKQYLLRALNGETFSIIEKYGLQDLHQFYYEVSFSLILDMDGQITGVSVFSVNISEKMESARQKLLAEKKFAELFEHSPDAVFVEDGSGTILDVNVAACKIQGRTKEELKGVNIRDLVPKENYCSILRDYKSLFLGASKQLESVIWTPDRGPVPVEITGNRISYDDQAALLIHLRDISERKKLEQERLQINIEKVRQKEELIRRSLLIKEQERSRIATEIHDDIGAGLSKISVICQVIKQLPNDPSTVSNHIDKIMQSSREVQENINEIIWAMNPQNDNLENLVAYLNYYASEYLESNILNFSFHLQSELPAIPVVGKVRRNIFLIVKESLHNIVKYAGPCDVNLKVQFENGAFRLEVLDNGNGFDMQVVSRFKNGIKNMYNRATDISGTFELNSSPGTGTSLVLTVPLMELF